MKATHAIDEARSEAINKEVLERADTDPGRKYDELASYMAQLRQYPALTNQAAFDALLRQHRTGRTEAERLRARDLIVYGNIKLVLSVALRHTGRGLGLLDMMQEGVIGLMTSALEKFDPSLGFRFSTYASQWIRQAITRAIANYGQNRPYRVPVHVLEKIQLVKRAIRVFEAKHGRLPDALEAFETVHSFSVQMASEIRLKDVSRVLRMLAEGYTYLDAPAYQDDSGETVGDLFVGEPPRTEVVVEAKRMFLECCQAIARIEKAVAELDPRSAMVVRLRYGLGEFEPMTLEEIGERYELTRERIRQIEAKALEQLAGYGITPEQIVKLLNVADELARIAQSWS